MEGLRSEEKDLVLNGRFEAVGLHGNRVGPGKHVGDVVDTFAAGLGCVTCARSIVDGSNGGVGNECAGRICNQSCEDGAELLRKRRVYEEGENGSKQRGFVTSFWPHATCEGNAIAHGMPPVTSAGLIVVRIPFGNGSDSTKPAKPKVRVWYTKSQYDKGTNYKWVK